MHFEQNLPSQGIAFFRHFTGTAKNMDVWLTNKVTLLLYLHDAQSSWFFIFYPLNMCCSTSWLLSVLSFKSGQFSGMRRKEYNTAVSNIFTMLIWNTQGKVNRRRTYEHPPKWLEQSMKANPLMLGFQVHVLQVSFIKSWLMKDCSNNPYYDYQHSVKPKIILSHRKSCIQA